MYLFFDKTDLSYITPIITVTVMITFTFSSLSVNQRKHQTHSSKIG
jgi:hypothetical protein